MFSNNYCISLKNCVLYKPFKGKVCVGGGGEEDEDFGPLEPK
jgi:hypothetical protein